MVQAFTATTTIDRPIDRVWQALTDWERAAEWMPGVQRAQADGDTAVGTTLTVHTRGKQRSSEITAVTPGQSIRLTSVQGGVTAHYVYSLQPDGEATRAHLVADCVTTGWWRLVARPLRWLIRRTDRGQLDALKRRIEAVDSEA